MVSEPSTEDTAIDFSIGSKHFHASLGLLGGLALALVLFLKLGGPNIALDQWLKSGAQEVQTTRTLLTRHDAYVRQATQARKHLSDSLGSLLGTLRAMQARGADLLANAQTAAQFRAAGAVLARNGQVCMDGLTLCRSRGDSLFRQDSVHTDSLRQALVRVDSSLAVGLSVASCHVLFLPCLGRVQSLELGVGLGLVAGLLLRR